MIIRNGTVVDAVNGTLEKRDVFVAAGRISTKSGDQRELDASGMMVAPGFIDIHVHLREPGQQHKETIASGTRAAAAGGFTSVCCMPNTAPVNDSVVVTRWMQSPDRGAVVNVFPIAAATVGSMGNELTHYAALLQAGAIAVTDDGKPILEDHVMRECLKRAKDVGLPVIQHAEDTRLTQHAPMNAGPVALRLGLKGWPAYAETSIVERDIALAEETGAHLHVAHLSTAGALDAVRRAKSRGVHVTCEVTPHHLVLTEECVARTSYDTNCKMNPPLRSEHDRLALIDGIFDGTVDAIATDHAPHGAHEKAVEFDRAPFGITGLESALGLMIEELHRLRGLPLPRLIGLLTSGPASVMGWTHRGNLEIGAHADITIFDPRETWKYESSRSLSRSHNSPFEGFEMRGRVRHTIVAGESVFSVQ